MNELKFQLEYHIEAEGGVGIETSDGMAVGWRKTEQGIQLEGFGTG